MYQPRKRAFHRISKHGEASRNVFDKLAGVWKCDETLSPVFDISSQLKPNLKRKRRNKIAKITLLCLKILSLRQGCEITSETHFYAKTHSADEQQNGQNLIRNLCMFLSYRQLELISLLRK